MPLTSTICSFPRHPHRIELSLSDRTDLRAPQDLAKQLRMQINVQVCGHSFPDLADTALFETWTRDPFRPHDRVARQIERLRTPESPPTRKSEAIIRRPSGNVIW